MPWLREYNEDDHHVCRLPDIRSKGVGSEWMCDGCKTVYQIKQKFFGERRRWANIGRFADGTYSGRVRDPEAHGLRPPRAPSGTSAGRVTSDAPQSATPPRPPAPRPASSSDANPKKLPHDQPEDEDRTRHLIVIPPDATEYPRTSCCGKLPNELDWRADALTTVASHCTCGGK